MKHLAKDALKWLLASAAVIVATGWVGTTKADIAYSYAQQAITNITLSGTGVTNGVMTGTSTSASAVIKGSGSATNDPTDTLQAYIGASPPAPQNSYVKYSSQGGGPQTGDFSRADAILSTGSTLFSTGGLAATNVAESILSTAGTGPGLATASGSWSFAGTFNAPTTSSITVAYNWANDILASITGPSATAQASFKMSITIKDQHGNEVDNSPTELNTALSAPPNSPEIMTSGSGSAILSLSSLTAGDVFTISITGTELSSAQLAPAVPEPGTFALAGMGGALALAFHAIRRRTRKV
jgi:hypothetical protein